MKRPVIEISYTKGDDDWEYAYFTMDLLILFYILPEKSKNNSLTRKFWLDNQLDDIVDGLKKGFVILKDNQFFVFLDGTDAISKLLLSDDQAFLDRIVIVVCNRTERFATSQEFKKYYLAHSTKLLKEIKGLFSASPTVSLFYDQIFTRCKDNLTYIE